MSSKNKPIIRLEKKMKSLSQIRESVRYTRRGVVGRPIDPEVKVGPVYGSDDPYRDAKEILSSVDNVRANAVYAIEFVMTASPTYFRESAYAWGEFEEPKLRAFLKTAIEWAKGYFGDNFVSATLHLDQATPHLHALVVPMLNGKLNCRELYGLRARLKKLQVSYAKAMAPLGLQRGTPEVGAKHTPRGKWVAEKEAEQRRQAEELKDRERAVAEEEERLRLLEEELSKREAKIFAAADAVRDYALETEGERALLETREKDLRLDVRAFDRDAKRFRNLLLGLEEMKIEVPEHVIEEASAIAEKFGVPLQ